MQEELLSTNEINLILKESESEKYSDPFLIHLGRKKTSIIMLSRESGLILIRGNNWTGYEHIHERHSLASRKPYWNENDKLENQTKFPIAPIEYIKVASSIYHSENKNSQKNKQVELFDMYTGSHKDTEEIEMKYNLITYKNTGIIHTFYLAENKKPFNKRKILDLRQGWAKSSFNFISGTQTFRIPYFDKSSIERFAIVLEIIPSEKLEKRFIQVNSLDGKPIKKILVASSETNQTIEFSLRNLNIDFEDFTEMEKEIKRIQDEN